MVYSKQVIEKAREAGWRVRNGNENPAFPCYVLMQPNGETHRPETWDAGLTEEQAWSMLPGDFAADEWRTHRD